MTIEAIIRRHGWLLVPREEWIAVQDLRPEFYNAFRTRRLGKLIDADFYVTLTGCPAITQGLILQAGGIPKTMKSKDRSRDMTYLGFDTSLVPEEKLTKFIRKVAGIIDDLI